MNSLSEIKLTKWKGNLTLFSSAFNPLPGRECIGKSWYELENIVAPGDKPRIEVNKYDALYFVSCELKIAPYVSKTREKAIENGWPLKGKQRSGEHVTEANMIVIDVDGATEKQFVMMVSMLKKEGIAFLIYSTYSHGLPNKQGVRCRLIVPVDRPLNKRDYRLASSGLTKLLGVDNE